MSYTDTMWQNYLDKVGKLYHQGLSIKEIALKLESDEELIKSVINKFFNT